MSGFGPTGSFPTGSIPGGGAAVTLTVVWTVLPSTGVNTGQVITDWEATASGGTAPYTYSVGSGSLPTGLSLNTSTGVISGTVTAISGSFTFVIHAVDSGTGTGDSSSRAVEVFNPAFATRKLTASGQQFSIEYKERHKPWVVPPRNPRKYISINVAPGRLTWSGIEVAYYSNAAARVTWSGVEVATPYSTYTGRRALTLQQIHGIIYRPRTKIRQKPKKSAATYYAQPTAHVTWDGVEVGYASNNPGRVTWSGTEIGYQTNAPGRVTWSGVEVGYLPSGPGRVTWSGGEVGYLTNGPGRVTWSGAEVGYVSNAAGRVTWSGIEIATPAVPWPQLRRQVFVTA